MRGYLLIILSLAFIQSYSQAIVVEGRVVDEENKPIGGVNVTSSGSGTFTNEHGEFQLNIQAGSSFINFSHINYIPRRDTLSNLSKDTTIYITLIQNTTILDEVAVNEEREREQISLVKLEPKDFSEFPFPSPDISRILVSLPGVISNNELSSSYSVRGGNFDENLIFVEDIPIYRPQIASNGQQEGLGFVNLSMVSEVNFSSGGWQAKYGDRLSSVLNIDYKKPEKFTADVVAGLLGGSATVGSKFGKTTFLAGIRHKNTRYLLNSLETEGEYLPRFTDFQLFTTTEINKTTSISFLGNYARNNYEVIPATRESEFGTFNQAYRLTVAFDGRDLLTYNTYQGGIKINKSWSHNYKSSIIFSAVKTIESEYTEVEGGYRLCDVNKNIGSSNFNECAVTLGIGTLYDHRRNYLEGELYSVRLENKIELDNGSSISVGVNWNYEKFDERISEYNFVDSADYVTEMSSLNANLSLTQKPITGFVSWEMPLGAHFLTLGSRFIYRPITDELRIDPRISYAYRPDNNQDIVWKLAVGIYSQVPVYREFRQLDGELNRELKMQTSAHFIAGMDKNLILWDRPFKLLTEAYYKKLWNVNPYEIDNVRIRYFGKNNAKAYAVGTDFRLSGEFIKNTESWFSLGILSTKENVEGDDKDYLRRPMDQRVTMSIFFQDHLPNNPSFRVNVHVQIGTGLPFGPPDDLVNRNTFNGDSYKRADVGFSKVFTKWKHIDEFTISAEILNLTGSQNVISYTWVEDVYDQQFAVPNTLSARFLNIKVGLKI